MRTLTRRWSQSPALQNLFLSNFKRTYGKDLYGENKKGDADPADAVPLSLKPDGRNAGNIGAGDSSLAAEACDGMEIELKLAVDTQALPELKRALRGMAGNRESRSRLVSTYYDTPDFLLRRNDMTLRIRRQRGGLIQTIKAEANGAGALARHEWEDEVAKPEPDPSASHAVGKLPGGLAADDLRPIFTTDVDRTTIDLQPAPDTNIEVAVDEGEIRAGDGEKEDISEIELELKCGDVQILYDVALQLAAVSLVRIGALTKAERGYLLSGAQDAPAAVSMSPLPLKKKMTVEQVIRQVGRQCLAHIIRNEPAALVGEPEGVHQMRVGARRLRSFLSAAKPMLPPEAYREVSDELKWLGSVLGDARSWDVFSSDLLPPVREVNGGNRSIAYLAGATRRARRLAHRSVEDAIRSERYTRTLLKLGRWFEACGWRNQPVSEKSIRLLSSIGAEAPRIMKRPWRQVRKRSRGFAELDAPARHKLRIAVKKMRYTSEFLGSLFDERRLKSFTKTLKPLQNDLGHVNDVRTAHRLIEKIDADDAGKSDGEARGMVFGWYDHGLARREAKLRKHVRKLRRADTFW